MKFLSQTPNQAQSQPRSRAVSYTHLQALAEKLNVDARSVHAYIMGEHGDSEFAVWSHANIAGVNLEEFLKDEENVQEAELVELFEGVRDAAYTIINKKGATYYGIAVALARITKAILDDENAVLPLSVFQEGQYGVNNIFIGQPAIVGAHLSLIHICHVLSRT